MEAFTAETSSRGSRQSAVRIITLSLWALTWCSAAVTGLALTGWTFAQEESAPQAPTSRPATTADTEKAPGAAGTRPKSESSSPHGDSGRGAESATEGTPMGFALARHLLTRTGFGAEPARLEEFATLTLEQGVDRLLAAVSPEPSTPWPAWVSDRSKDLDRKTAERQEVRRQLRRRVEELRGWWLQEMVTTPSPLTEHMTLFWSNHFTTSARKVRGPRLLQRQNALLRQHALGNFKTLLHAVAKDPAMLLFLDTVRSQRKKPNENFARELLELFTLGEGNYTERDIKEAARAFTGWRIRREEGTFFFARRQHDRGSKEFMGKTGRFGGEEIIDIVLQSPEVANWIVGKLWREFVSPQPNPAEVEKIAAVFRDSAYELAPTLRALLLTPSFADPKQRGQLVKSPVDFLVGTLRTFGVEPQEPARLVRAVRQMEQDLFEPPNVKGWPGGTAWITTTTLLTRHDLAVAMVNGQNRERGNARARRRRPQSRPRSAMQNKIVTWAEELRGLSWSSGDSGMNSGMDSATTSELPKELQRIVSVLCPVPPFDPIPETGDPIKCVRTLLVDPTYQLK